MNRPQKRDSLAGYALAMVAVIIALLAVSVFGMSQASAGGVHRAACKVVAQQAVVAAAVPYPVIGYQVGQHLQQAAVDEYGFRASPSKERLTFLEGYYQASQRLTDSGLGSAGPSRPATGHPAATEGGQTNGGQCQAAEPAVAEPPAFSAPQSAVGKFIERIGGYPPAPDSFAATHPTLAAACASCHSGETPNGDLNIAHEVLTAKANADCPTILAMVDSIATGAMPKGKPMSEADRLAAIAELLSK